MSLGHWRLVLLGMTLMLGWVGMGYRLVRVQLVDAERLRQEAITARLTVREIAAQRGNIFDRNGDPLAMTIEAESLFVIPEEVDEPVYLAQQIGGLLGRDPADLLADITAGKGFVYVQRQVELALAQQVTAMGLPGLYSHRESKRVYPTGAISSHVVGFVDLDGKGLEGIEYEFNNSLRGVPGRLLYERDPSGTPIPWAPRENTPAVPGADLLTTIDLPIQYSAQTACRAMLDASEAVGCWVVVLDVETGAVLAMAGVPEFDPDLRIAADGSAFTNFAVRGTYEPGSIMKLVTLAAGLEEEIVSPHTVISRVADQIELRPGACVSNDDEVFGCYADFSHHETRDMTVQEVFTESSNVGTIKMARMLPAGVVAEYLHRFGLGSVTGIDYSGEAQGAIMMDAGCQICPLSAAIGYGVAVTPLQMAAAYAAVANDGILMRPHLIASEVALNEDMRLAGSAGPRVISEDTAWLIRQLLAMVVEEGTGETAQIPGYQVGGKTGTADKLGPDGRYTEITMASFVGMAPIDDPKLVVAVVVDSPSYEYRTGGQAAGPVFAEVMEQALHRLGVTPDASTR
jgi:cell division protein FtsI/penicillin-binding protein 2